MDKDEIRTNDLAKAIKAHLKCSDKEALEKAQIIINRKEKSEVKK